VKSDNNSIQARTKYKIAEQQLGLQEMSAFEDQRTLFGVHHAPELLVSGHSDTGLREAHHSHKKLPRHQQQSCIVTHHVAGERYINRRHHKRCGLEVEERFHPKQCVLKQGPRDRQWRHPNFGGR
jgi:hypothetical protein